MTTPTDPENTGPSPAAGADPEPSGATPAGDAGAGPVRGSGAGPVSGGGAGPVPGGGASPVSGGSAGPLPSGGGGPEPGEGAGPGSGGDARAAAGPDVAVGPDAGAGPDVAGADAEAGPDAEAVAAGEKRRQRAISGMLAAGLILEAITVLFVPRTIAAVSDEGLTGSRLALLLTLAGALFVVAFLQRRRAGLVLGSVLQVAVIATGVLVGAMYVVGLVFAGIWAYLLYGRQQILQAATLHGTPEAAPPG